MSESGAESWGNRLRKRAIELGLNDTQVATRIGMTQRRYSSYVNMTRQPKFDDLLRICEGLSVTPDYVLGVKPMEAGDAAERRILLALRTMPPNVRAMAVAAVEAMVEAVDQPKRSGKGNATAES